MKVLVITSCTGEKTDNFEGQPVLEDFQRGESHFVGLEKKFSKHLQAAEKLYAGRQHLRLMQAVEQLRKQKKVQLDLYILSAGYGLIPSSQQILPYEVTFNSLNAGNLQDWAGKLNIPTRFRELLQQPYDFCLVLLGEKYWQACDLHTLSNSPVPVLAFCNTTVEAKLGAWANVKAVSLANKDAKRFRCNLIGLKGELGGRILIGLSKGLSPSKLKEMSSEEILAVLEKEEGALLMTSEKQKVKKARVIKPVVLRVPLPHIDKVVNLTDEWKQSPHRNKLRYFIPDWDDLVDPDYDFLNDKLSNDSSDWSNAVYAHQLHDQPCYDGILVSKITIDQNRQKQARIQEIGGIHRQLRIPGVMPVMGDCGAFGYIKEEKPPFSTSDILDYYSNYGFDLGVSVDHIIIGNDLEEIRRRYEITIQNAEDFINEHKKGDLPWTPIGAVQGWDPGSYAKAAQQYVKMGYQYLGIGGLVRRNTNELLSIVKEVTAVVPNDIQIHLFGISRLNALRLCQQMGVTSVDSASYLRKAWLGQKDNYYTVDGEKYAALRIPEVGNSVRTKKAMQEQNIDFDTLKARETACIRAVRAYNKGMAALESVLDLLEEYDRLLDDKAKSRRLDYQRTLEDKPWQSCPCSICKKHGVEVIIFRNNNRNRRRGFHNTYVFYDLLKKVINNPNFHVNQEHLLFERKVLDEKKQLNIY